MYDTPSKPATEAYRENWDRIWGKKPSVILDPTQAQDEMLFVSSAGTAYRIVNMRNSTEGE